VHLWLRLIDAVFTAWADPAAASALRYGALGFCGCLHHLKLDTSEPV
jgi:hypothetical protein